MSAAEVLPFPDFNPSDEERAKLTLMRQQAAWFSVESCLGALAAVEGAVLSYASKDLLPDGSPRFYRAEQWAARNIVSIAKTQE